MKPFPSQIASNLLKKPSPAGLAEICAVINLDNEPCLLIDKDENTVLFINSRFINLSGFTSEILIGKPFQTLISGLDLNSIVSGQKYPIDVILRDKSSLSVMAQVNFLDQKTRLLRLRIIDETDNESEKSTGNGGKTERLLELATLGECENLIGALTKGAEILHDVSGVEAVCIYQANPEFPQFERIAAAGMGNEFPDTLPTIDSMRLSSPMIWNSGIRVLTDLHRFGRSHNYRYIGSAPLGEATALVGLIICAGKGEQPDSLTEDILQVFASQIWSLQQHYLLVENLQKENRSLTGVIHLLDASFNSISEGVIILKPDLTIHHINPAAEWILGYNSKEVEGQEYGNVLIGTDRISPALEDAKKGNSTHNLGKITLNRRDGQAFPALVQVLPVMMKDSLIGIEIILSDISENENNKALTQHLEHRASIGDFTATFAHDIRNPINNIVTGMQLLSIKLPEDDPNQEVINRLQGDCTRLNHLMESLLAYSRMNDMRFEPVDIASFLRKTLDRWHPRLMRESITPVIQIEENIDKMNGDPRALDRVFTNLISNAVDAMAESGDTLAVKVSMNRKVPDLPLVEVSISDNGPGIPDDIKDRIFEPFVSTNNQKGTGLGLAITKQIVSALKGSISVKTFPGGTVFTVSIPAYLGEKQ